MKRTKSLIAVIAGVVLVAFAFGITKINANAGSQGLAGKLSALTEERAMLIQERVKDAKQKLEQYSSAEEITALLRDPENSTLAENAQRYTEESAKDIENLEALYTASPITCMLAHSDPSMVGMVTRADSKGRQAILDQALNADGGFYFGGISRVSRTMEPIIYMYRGIFGDGGGLLGLTGISLLAEPLMESSSIANVKGAENAAFSMLDVTTALCQYSTDASVSGKKAERTEILELCTKLSGQEQSASGSIEYQDDAGKHLAAYSYMPEYNWLLILDAVQS